MRRLHALPQAEGRDRARRRPRRPRRPIPAKDPGAKTQSKPGAIVQKATADTQNASDRAEQAAGTSQGIDDGKTDGTTSVGPASSGVNTNPVTKAPATGQTSAPAPITNDALASLPKDVRKAIKQRKVLALLFWNNRSYDDRAVRRELKHVSTYGKQVFVAARPIKNVARYQAITRGVDVEQSPTIVVVDSNLKAVTLVGYVDRDTIDQAVVDAHPRLRRQPDQEPVLPPPRRHLRLRRAADQGAAAAVRGCRHPRLPRRRAGRLPWT